MRTKFNGILTLILAFVVQASFAQMTITGTVQDDMGPIPGASVLVKGTQNGTVTDFDGKYTITANTGDTLVFSMAGNSTEKVVGTSSVIDAEIGVEELEGIVMTSLGIKKSEKSLGYASQTVEGKNLTRVKSTNVTNSFAGKIAGINVTASSGGVNASTRITIRGVSTLSGNDQPLVVVDGVPVDNTSYNSVSGGKGVDSQNGMADINQDDIASVNVLKGGAATAIYGMRGANGVILITTKSGRKSKGLGISASSSIAFNTVAVLPDYQNSYGQGNSLNTFRYVDGYGNASATTSGLGGLDESWGPALDRGLEFVQWNSFDGQPLPWVSSPDSMRDDFYQVGVTTTNNVSFANATDNSDYRMSFGLMNDKGIIPNTDLKRLNLGAAMNFKLSEKWKANFSANYAKSSSDNTAGTGYDTTENNNVISQLVWSARQINWGDLKDYKNLPLVTTGNNTGTPVNWNQAYNNNPFWMLDNNLNGFTKNRFFGNASLSYAFTDNFDISIRTGIDTFSSLTTRRAAKGTSGNRDGYYRERNRNVSEVNTQILAKYNKDLNDKFSLTFNVGGNMMEKNYRSIDRKANALQLPDLYTISNIKDGSTVEQSTYESKSKINSLFAFGSLSYNNYLFLEFSGRNDWASVLPIANNNFFYPAASISAIVTDMLDIKGDGLSYLKLRGGISKVGDAGPLSPYNIEPAYKYDPQAWGSTPVLYLPTTLWNPNIKNQDTKEIEVGLDAKFIKNIFNLSLTYYDKLTTDVILPKTVSTASGVSSVWQNAASISNKGVELSLGTKFWNKPGKGFKLSTTVNFGKNNNLVDDIDTDPTTNNGVYDLARAQWAVTPQAREGQPLGVLYGSSYLRDPEGNLIFRNGAVVQGPQKILGNSTPDWTAGIAINASYKGFSFYTLLDGKKGGNVYSQTNFWGKYTGILKETMYNRETGIVGDGVMLDANNNYVPNNVVVTAKDYFQSTFNNSIGEAGIYDASFIKWRELALNYSLDKKVLGNSGLQGVTFGISVRNLAILYKKVPHIDPETGFSSSAGNQGMEYAQIPTSRSISANLNIKF